MQSELTIENCCPLHGVKKAKLIKPVEIDGKFYGTHIRCRAPHVHVDYEGEECSSVECKYKRQTQQKCELVNCPYDNFLGY